MWNSHGRRTDDQTEEANRGHQHGVHGRSNGGHGVGGDCPAGVRADAVAGAEAGVDGVVGPLLALASHPVAFRGGSILSSLGCARLLLPRFACGGCYWKSSCE